MIIEKLGKGEKGTVRRIEGRKVFLYHHAAFKSAGDIT